MGEGERPPPCGAPRVSASHFSEDAGQKVMHDPSQLTSQRSLMGLRILLLWGLQVSRHPGTGQGARLACPRFGEQAP